MKIVITIGLVLFVSLGLMPRVKEAKSDIQLANIQTNLVATGLDDPFILRLMYEPVQQIPLGNDPFNLDNQNRQIAPNCLHRIQIPTKPDGPGTEINNPVVLATITEMLAGNP